MTAKEYLKQSITIDMEINCKKEELQQLKQKIRCMQAIKVFEFVQSNQEDYNNRTINKILDLQREINTEICKLIDLKSEIRDKINSLDNVTHRSIMIGYYINGLSLEEISEKINYSDRHIRRLHKSALEEFCKKFNMI